jgi:hypothetical protein
VTNLTAGRGITVSASTGSSQVSWTSTISPVFPSQTFFDGNLVTNNNTSSWSGSNLATWNFTVPDGPNQAVFMYSISANCSTTGGDGAVYAIINTNTATLNDGMQYIGGQSGTTTTTNNTISIPQQAGFSPFATRVVRINLISLPGSGTRNFSISWSCSGTATLSGGGSGTVGVGGTQAYLQPFQV